MKKLKMYRFVHMYYHNGEVIHAVSDDQINFDPFTTKGLKEMQEEFEKRISQKIYLKGQVLITNIIPLND